MVQKNLDVDSQIADIITKQFKDDSGLVFCLYKKECEIHSKRINESRISAEFYHSDVLDATRVQTDWMCGWKNQGDLLNHCFRNGGQ